MDYPSMYINMEWAGTQPMRARVLGLVGVILFAVFLQEVPVAAHSTLGNLIPLAPYHAQDVSPHVPGPTVYLWPGAGEAAYSGAPDGLPSGYVDPYTSTGLSPSSPDGYAPYGAILTSTANNENYGSLILAMNFTNPCTFGWNDVDHTCVSGVPYMANYTGITIYIPPEFDLSNLVGSYNVGLIQTTFAANANDVVAVWKASNTDPWGPGWWVISFDGDIHWWPQHDYREWYYMRINDIGAPTIAGKYFFKVFLFDEFFNFVYPGMTRNLIVNGHQCGVCNEGTLANPSSNVPYSGATNATVPVENWPVLLVKGELDPGIITGTIRYGSYNQTLYGNPVDLSGRVRAVGVAINPYEPGLQTTGRQVEARGYFNESAMGHFEVEGVAPGVYSLYASAAGYPEQLIASNLIILPGQSIHLNGYLNPGPTIEGQVFSKNLFGEQPWPEQPRPVYVGVYRNDDFVDSNLAVGSPLNFTHQPYMAYDWDYYAPNPSLPTPRPVAFPWAAGTASWGGSYYEEVFNSPPANPNYNSHLPTTCGGAVDYCGKPNGVGPAQYWWVDSAGVFTNGGGSSSFIFRFGQPGIYGAPTDFDGHIPQSFAGWVNGLGSGTYWLQVWINGYVQTLEDGSTMNQVQFSISGDDWGGDVYVPVDVHVSGSVVIDAQFHDQPNTLQDCPVDGCMGHEAVGLSRGNRYLIAELRDPAGSLVGINFTYVLASQSSVDIEVNGFGMIGPDSLTGVKYSYYAYQDYPDYGLPAGTYRIYLYMRGYLEDVIEPVSVAPGDGVTTVSEQLHRGAMLNVTVYSVDWEAPRIQTPWEFPGAQFRLYVADSTGRIYGYVGYDDLTTLDREGEPARQPVCYTRSPLEPFCPTGIPQVIAANDPIGSTIVVDSWDGYSGAEEDTPGLPAGSIQFGGGYVPPWDIGGFLITTYDYRFDQTDNFSPADALKTGMYYPYGFTYGYVQRHEFNLYATEGAVANTQMSLLEGANLTLNVVFKDEGNLQPTQFNMSMRVRVFDQYGNLIATASSKSPDTASLRTDFSSPNYFGLGRFTGQNIDPATTISESYYPDPFTVSPSAGPNPQGTNTITSIAANSSDTFLWYGSWPIGGGGSMVTGWQGFDSNPNHDGVSAFATFQSNSNFWGLQEWKTTIPYGTEQVKVFLAGIYDPFGDPLDDFNYALLHTRSWKRAQGEAIDSMFYGILNAGTENAYTGPWSVEVDCWNEYPAPQPGDGLAPPTADWYPPVQGLLEGDSFHFIPDGSSTAFGFVGNTLAANGLGPYGQSREWSLPNTGNGTEISAIYSLEKRGYISGTIEALNQFNELDTLSWATVTADLSASNITFMQWSWDGHFEMYLPAGGYTISVAYGPPNVGYSNLSAKVEVSSGESLAGLDFILNRNAVPLQNGIEAVIAIPAACLFGDLLKRRKRVNFQESRNSEKE